MVTESSILSSVTMLTAAAIEKSESPLDDGGKAVAAFIETVTLKLRDLYQGDDTPEES